MLRKLAKNSTFKTTLWLVMGYLIRQGTQVLSFIILATTLKVEGFGAFTSILAIALILSPFVEMGGYSLVVRDIERGDSIPIAAGRAFSMSLTLILPALFVILLIKPVVFNNLSWIFVLCVVCGELFSNRVLSISAGVNVATGYARRNAVVESAMGITRLILTVILQKLHGDLITWGYIYFFQSFAMAFIVIIWMMKTWGSLIITLPPLYWTRLQEGLHFAFGFSAQSSSTELDKVMLVRFSSLQEVGIFSAAQRIANLSNILIFALLTSVYPNFFKKGSESYSSARKYAIKLLPITVGYGLFVVAFFWFVSPHLSLLLGEGFADSESALRWLCVLVLINAVHYPLGDALTGSGLQKIRTNMYVVSLIINVSLNIILIPKLGWLGAVYATIVSQFILVMMLVFYRPRPSGISII